MREILTLMVGATICCYATLTNAEEYSVGTRSDGLPYVEINSEGIPHGFDVDVIEAIAEDQGFDINIRVKDFGELMPKVGSGEYDLAIGGITITPSLAEKYDFSDAYFQDYIATLTIDDSLDVSTVEKVSQLNVALEKDSLPAQLFEELGVEPYLADSVFLGIKAVAQGKAEVFLHQEYIMSYAIKKYQAVHFYIDRTNYGDFFPEINLRMVVKKGNIELLDKLNQGLANIKSDGTLEEIKNKWGMN